ncbi:hypothetical protein [Actinacidiphila sp. bgisy144]|uniref:hypothetical protein n=1 Tax=Actinacidiphila sp. bgisy144 TaxID=3413791 RepID=UPI003EB7F6DE
MPRPADISSTSSAALADRIAELFGQPLADLKALVADTPYATLLGALTRSHAELVLAEHSIALHVARLHELTAGEEVGRPQVGQITNCARRIAEGVVARDAFAASISAVLGGLRRAPGTDTSPARPAPAAPLATPSRTH